MTEIKAGRELDALIAEKVIGWIDAMEDDNGRGCRGFPNINEASTFGEGGHTQEIPHYSTDIGAAMEIVEKLSFMWGFAAFRYPGISSMGYGWVVAFAHSLRPYSLEIVTLGDPAKVKHAHSDSLPLAICNAALQAIETMGKE